MGASNPFVMRSQSEDPGGGVPRRAGVRRRLLLLTAGAAAVIAPVALSPMGTTAAAAVHQHLNCIRASLCTEVVDSEQVFGEGVYVGHDEPSLLFYSNKPGSGNRYSSILTLPTQPATNQTPGKASYDFQLHPAFWFGMAMCDTQSYPELLHSCTPDSDSNIADPAVTANHAGTAFMEMQFYPPGWVPFNNPGGISCSATQWCAALNIDSLSSNPVTGQQNNAVCESTAGEEYVNFAFITLNGVPQAPPNPVNATATTFTPDPTKDLMMNGGDNVSVKLHDTAHGLRIDLNDRTTHQSGFMVASAANDFAQVKFDPSGSGCTAIPYNFHPMYSTSSPMTRVTWAAHTYNVAFSDEIGHFDYCSAPNSSLGCNSGGKEGTGANKEPSDADDFFCFPGGDATLYLIGGCANTNVPGFDGTSYLNDWADGVHTNRPTPIEFTSFLTGDHYGTNYTRAGFETDLPRVEQGIAGCDPFNDVGCTLLPTTDDGTAAPFYPYYTIASHGGNCTWVYGSTVAGLTTNNFGANNQYGTYDSGVDYTGLGGTPFAKADDFRNIVSNPCPA
jgi:hypothetical protein